MPLPRSMHMPGSRSMWETRGGTSVVIMASIGLLCLSAPCSPSATVSTSPSRSCCKMTNEVAAQGTHNLEHSQAGESFLRQGCTSRGRHVQGCRNDVPGTAARDPRRSSIRLRGGSGEIGDLSVANTGVFAAGVDATRVVLRGGAGEGTEEIRTGLENVSQVEDDGNQTKVVCNTDGGCPHGRHSDNPDEQHCMECEVMAFLQVFIYVSHIQVHTYEIHM